MLLWLPVGGMTLLGNLALPGSLAPPASAAPESIERIAVSTGPLPVSWLQSPAALSVQPLNPTLQTDALALLQGIAGLQVDVRSNLAQDSRLSLRGFGSRSSFGVRGLRMTLDGIPLTTPDGQTQPSALFTADLAAVSVLKGPFAALYGNAAGGVVAFDSKPTEPGLLQLQQQHSSTMRQQLLRADSDFGSLMLQQTDFQGIRPHNRAERQAALWKHQWQLGDDIRLNARFDWSRDPRLDDPGALTLTEWQTNPLQTSALASRFDSHKSTRQHQAGISVQSSDWQFSSYLTSRQINQLLTQSGEAISSSGGIVQLSRQMAGLQWQQQHQWQELAWQWGLSHEQSRDERQGYVNQFGQAGALRRDDRSDSRSQDATLRLSYALTPSLSLFAGGRLAFLKFSSQDYFVVPGNPDDSGDKSQQGHAHALGFSYALTDELSWHASTGRGFESPTLTEMAYQRNGSGLNLQLAPAQNRQWDSGLKWLRQEHNGERSLLQFDTFFLTSSNELVVDISSGGRTVFKNAAGTRRQGTELTLQRHWASGWQAEYSFSYLDAVYDNPSDPSHGLQLPGVASNQHALRLSFAPGEHWFAAAGYRRLSRVAVDDRHAQFAPGYGLFDLQTGWSGQAGALQWRVDLSAQNLTDEQYVGAVVVNQSSGRSFEPGIPRQLSAGIQLSFQLP
ncbi:TonB-dependent receptor family protein [Rheinheimera texasensis]|uniref:TonB-dependent receptor family protein n=1 Tax=Rheinheimera texasensis TaxID=306205 RepID=UPI00068E8F61|nr:TonB-dependent receptor [Rheinheimera texasensis]